MKRRRRCSGVRPMPSSSTSKRTLTTVAVASMDGGRSTRWWAEAVPAPPCGAAASKGRRGSATGSGSSTELPDMMTAELGEAAPPSAAAVAGRGGATIAQTRRAATDTEAAARATQRRSTGTPEATSAGGCSSSTSAAAAATAAAASEERAATEGVTEREKFPVARPSARACRGASQGGAGWVPLVPLSNAPVLRWASPPPSSQPGPSDSAPRQRPRDLSHAWPSRRCGRGCGRVPSPH